MGVTVTAHTNLFLCYVIKIIPDIKYLYCTSLKSNLYILNYCLLSADYNEWKNKIKNICERKIFCQGCRDIFFILNKVSVLLYKQTSKKVISVCLKE